MHLPGAVCDERHSVVDDLPFKYHNTVVPGGVFSFLNLGSLNGDPLSFVRLYGRAATA
jgi:hypothetical protein